MTGPSTFTLQHSESTGRPQEESIFNISTLGTGNSLFKYIIGQDDTSSSELFRISKSADKNTELLEDWTLPHGFLNIGEDSPRMFYTQDSTSKCPAPIGFSVFSFLSFMMIVLNTVVSAVNVINNNNNNNNNNDNNNNNENNNNNNNNLNLNQVMDNNTEKRSLRGITERKKGVDHTHERTARQMNEDFDYAKSENTSNEDTLQELRERIRQSPWDMRLGMLPNLPGCGCGLDNLDLVPTTLNIISNWAVQASAVVSPTFVGKNSGTLSVVLFLQWTKDSYTVELL
ncbi:hypothetical protein SK128_003491 [Halocaridina rubra]|uniref:Uncharacterized protein n=1 Tax=Halocaridina rubra TaxID=373956 RepID=A0AAN8X9P5_HALRR